MLASNHGLCFCQSFLSPADADYIRARIAYAIHIAFGQGQSAPIIPRNVAALLAWIPYINNIKFAQDIANGNVWYTTLIKYSHHVYHDGDVAQIDQAWPASNMWLLKTFAPDLVANNGNLNIDIALLIVQGSLKDL